MGTTDVHDWVVVTTCGRCSRESRVRIEQVTRASAEFFARVQDGLAHVSGISLAPPESAGKCTRCGGPSYSYVIDDDGLPVQLTIHRTHGDGVPHERDDATSTVPIILPKEPE